MSSGPKSYEAFLTRLKGYERLEPFPRSRGPEKLEPARLLAAELGHPERGTGMIHIAGTNGKGMTASMIARLLNGAGGSVGLYTSPHVADIRERIVIQGEPIRPALFAMVGHRVLDRADRLRAGRHFSYFDLLTLIALEAFREAAVEWAVVETGLGGTSDATNIIPEKKLCVLTRIGLDHLHVLGDNLKDIAAQKLGIVRPGVPTVVAEQAAELTPWLRERLASLGSPLLDATGYSLTAGGDTPGSVSLTAPGGQTLDLPGSGVVGLPGSAVVGLPANAAAHLTRPQAASAVTALAAADGLLGGCRGEALMGRLKTVLNTRLPGRLELRHNQGVPGISNRLETVVLDGAHNPEAIEALGEQLVRWGLEGYALLFTLQNDKLVDALGPPLRELLDGAERVITLAPQTPRAPTTAALHQFLETWRPPGRSGPGIQLAPTPRAALEMAANQPDQPLVVAGSLWLVGDVIRLFQDDPDRSGSERGDS